MIPALIGLVVAVVAAVAAVVYMRAQSDSERRAVASEKERLSEASAEVEQQRKTIALEAKEEALRGGAEVEQESRERRGEMSRLEQRATQREQQLERKLA